MVFGRPSRLATGHAAERRVDRAARRRGWQCIAANYNVRGGELDRVYRTPEAIVVVEVRYRTRSDYGSAVASVTAAKQRRIVLATRYFLVEHPSLAEWPIRFDVVGVDADNTLDWIENAFYAE